MNYQKALKQMSVAACVAFTGFSLAWADNRSVRKSLPSALGDADYHSVGQQGDAKFELGKRLFFDKELSGNRNTSCATCHHTLTDTGDGLSLPVGEGGVGLGITRDTGNGINAIYERVPRNAPAVFNLGAREFVRMFHDGRVEVNSTRPSGFDSPAGDDLPLGLETILAAQAMFPVTSGTEMAGQAGENSVADAAAAGNLSGPGGVWEQLAVRLQAIPEYVNHFIAAFPDVTQASDITFVHAANAIAVFESIAWRADNSPFDQYLRGDRHAMSKNARVGMKLFYGKAGCSDCHSGPFQTDHQFHAIAMPQIGPGKGDGVDGHDDFGRERVTLNPADRFRFRTPSLRNVVLTGPWGHDGAFNNLEGIVRHHVNTVASLSNYDMTQAVLPSRADLDALDYIAHDNAMRRDAIAEANELYPVNLSERDIRHLLDFLHALTDPNSIDLRNDMPKRVPSGLTLAE
jgi:cytochrome c peroxidase